MRAYLAVVPSSIIPSKHRAILFSVVKNGWGRSVPDGTLHAPQTTRELFQIGSVRVQTVSVRFLPDTCLVLTRFGIATFILRDHGTRQVS